MQEKANPFPKPVITSEMLRKQLYFLLERTSYVDDAAKRSEMIRFAVETLKELDSAEKFK